MMEINDKYLVKQIDKDLAALKTLLEVGKLSGTSDSVDQYEIELAKFFGSKYALSVSSGSTALHAAIYAAGVREGDQVAVPATSILPTVLPVLTANATPLVVDIEEDGIGIDLNDLRSKLTPMTKAVIQLPLWGYPTDSKKLREFCDENGLILIEDAAQAHGSKLGDKYIGTLGHMGCFSTHDRKILSSGEGGFILTDDEELYEELKKFTRLGFLKGVDYGVNYKLSSLQTVLAQSRLGQVSSQVEERVKVGETLTERLEEIGFSVLQIPEGDTGNYYSLVLHLPWDPETNLEFITEVSDHGIPSDITKFKYRPIYERDIFSEFKTPCPNAEEFISKMTTVPIRPNFSDEEIDYIVSTYKAAFNKYNSMKG